MKPFVAAFIVTAVLLGFGSFVVDNVHAHPNHPPVPVLSITTDITWSEHIRPIFREKCMNCHSPAGILLPEFDLSTYAGFDDRSGARDWVRAIEETVLTRRMPPWGADFRYNSFSNRRLLTQDEIDKIVAWTRGGRPQGPDKGLPTPAEFLNRDWRLGEPDLVFEMPEPHVLPRGVTRNQAGFTFPVQLTSETKWVDAVEFFPGDPTIVHTLIALVHEPARETPYTLDLEIAKTYDLEKGWDETRAVRKKTYGPGTRFLGQWTRGDGPVSFPVNAGRILRDGATLELRVFYHRDPFEADYETAQDSSKFGIHFAAEDVRQISESLVIKNKDFVIEAGESNHEVRAAATLGEAGYLHAAYPHMGLLGKEFELRAHYPDGRAVTLLLVPGYEFAYNQSYRFEAPLFAPAGTRLEAIGRYDNSADNWNNPNNPPKQVKAPDEERLLLFIDYVTADRVYRAEATGAEAHGQAVEMK